jgi:hypothetical protein
MKIESDVVEGLFATGYLAGEDREQLPKVRRALIRFQRHAARPYRRPLPDAGSDLGLLPTGVCDGRTRAALAEWVARGWTLPLGRFRLHQLRIGEGRPIVLREDAAAAWMEIVLLADSKGATLRGEYGDSARPVRPTSKEGTSRYSFHYAGRAVDISQDFTKSANHRYFVVSDPIGATQYWRILCRTDKQDGSQGSLIRSATVKWHQFNPPAEVPLPEGYYIDLTALIESTGRFQRIKAQGGWESKYNRSEWWHFQYKQDIQATFLDEMELVGYSESKLRACGWTTDEMLDHAPG